MACRQLGFERGVFREVERTPEGMTLLPAWLGPTSPPCTGSKATLQECSGGMFTFGETGGCRFNQRLVCSNNTCATKTVAYRDLQQRGEELCLVDAVQTTDIKNARILFSGTWLTACY